MTTMTLEQLLSTTPDEELLSIHAEIASCIVPATGAAHAFVRKVNKMIDAGKLCIRADSYRKVYLPTLAKAVLKEMASRYANYCYNMKSMTTVQNGDADGDTHKCAWCGEEFDNSELHGTDLGVLCDHCIAAIRSRGEEVIIYD